MTMPKTAVVPGSFDPVTLGHFRLVLQASELFDRVAVALMDNPGKKYCFSTDTRVDFCREAFSSLGNVTVSFFDGQLADVCKKVGAEVIVKGVRNCIDFEYEYDYFVWNRAISGGINTIFLPSEPELRYVSSSAVRELLRIGAPLSGSVPEGLEEKSGYVMRIENNKIERSGHQ